MNTVTKHSAIGVMSTNKCSKTMFCRGMKRRGFTITELIIVVTIMAILLVLGVVNLRGTQANARDIERRADAESIALHLETYYNSDSDITNDSGSYPSIEPINGIIGNETDFLKDIDIESLKAPGMTSSSLLAATSNGAQSGVSIDQYIYQPLKSDGELCLLNSDECAKFNIYYKLEVASISSQCPDPGLICKISSKNQ